MDPHQTVSATSSPASPVTRSKRRGLALRVLGWALLAIALLFALVYVRLLFGPISLNFLSDRMQGVVSELLDDSYNVEWLDFGVSLDGPILPAFHLSTVALTEKATGARIAMSALEIGVSPVGALFGRPQVRVTLTEPHFQMVQDLLGPRMSSFAFVEDAESGDIIAQIIEGSAAMPLVAISEEGLTLGDARPLDGLRSDNDWLIYNFEAMNSALADVAARADEGQIARITVRNGSMEILDTVYGLHKSFHAVNAEIRGGRNAERVTAIFSADIGGRTMHGTMARRVIDGVAHIDADVEAIDFSTIIPFLDDPDGLAALRGAGALAARLSFDRDSGTALGGQFTVDLTGISLRLENDLFPIETAPFDVLWTPEQSRFHFAEVPLVIGKSRATLMGDMVLGLDRQFGPTVGISVRALDVWLHPEDMTEPSEPFESFSFEGWSAPLYGALGIDRMVASKEGVALVVQGRIDSLREGVGLDVRLSGRGASADDFKRLWPYLFAAEARDWFVDYVMDGSVHSADMHFNFPVGTLAAEGEQQRLPEGSMTIDLVGSGVELQPFEGIPQFAVEGESRVTVRDNQFTMSFERARVPGPAGDIEVANAAFLNQDTSAEAQVFEISGDVSGTVPALVTLANREPLNLLDDFEFGMDLEELASQIDGTVHTTVIATIANDDAGRMVGSDYALNGTVDNLQTNSPIEGISLSDANLSFTASQEGFRVVGRGHAQDLAFDVQATKSGNDEPEVVLATTLGVADAQRFGVDLSEFITGQVRLLAKPLKDGALQLSADLVDAGITLRDIGVSKPRGTPGTLNAVLRLGEDLVQVDDVDLGFQTVRMQGALSFTPAGVMQSADFSTFQLSPGDRARVTMVPIDNGFSIAVRGTQLDIKPVLRRFFNLEGDMTAGASADLQDQVFTVSVQLDRALGHYGAAAYNVDLDLSVRGEELRRVNLSAQLGGDRTMSATTNPLPGGRVISYAANDIGAVLRFIGIYPRLAGGEGSLVMQYDTASRTDTGEFVVRDFAIVDEANIANIVGSHADSREMIARGNSLEFESGRAQFVRTRNNIQVIDGALYGDTIGGTIRGNIFTSAGQYDLAGTYVPLFGLNNVFQQIPLLGPIFGGREGEGLIGVTFAIRGPLNQPEVHVNPVSILAPGVFRSLFEYRAAGQGGR